MASPRVTVLMPVYNGAAYLDEAVRSILDQTFTDFELLIIDDGSTDRSVEIVQSFSDPRIRLHRNDRNLGLIATLNKGLSFAAGDYIVRLDCDDVSLPTRLERQVDFMDRNPQIGIAGTWFEKIMDGNSMRIKVPENDAMIRFYLIFDNTFLHSSIIIRKTFLDEQGLRYDPAFLHAEDYEFWVRCAKITELANLPEVLVRYRYHSGNISNRFRSEQADTADQVRCLHLRSLGLIPNEDECRLHLDLIGFRFAGDLDRLRIAALWLDRLVEISGDSLHVPADILYSELGRRWYGACGAVADRGLDVWRLFRSLPAGRNAGFQWQWKLLLRCLLHKSIKESD